jgi:hypothetical protein
LELRQLFVAFTQNHLMAKLSHQVDWCVSAPQSSEAKFVKVVNSSEELSVELAWAQMAQDYN